MGKKRSRGTYHSKGERRAVAKSTVKAVRRDRSPFDIELNKLDAWRKGKNPWLTIKNPSGETNKRFIKVKANKVLGDPKGRRHVVEAESDS